MTSVSILWENHSYRLKTTLFLKFQKDHFVRFKKDEDDSKFQHVEHISNCSEK